MADVTLTLKSERWLDEVVLEGDTTNVGADAVHRYSLPAGLGDVALMELWFRSGAAATLVTAWDTLGMSGTIQTGGAFTNVDIVGVSRFFKAGALVLAAYMSPDPLVLWRQSEVLALELPELDTNGAPTDDHKVLIKVVRVRPIESPARGPVRLVR